MDHVYSLLVYNNFKIDYSVKIIPTLIQGSDYPDFFAHYIILFFMIIYSFKKNVSDTRFAGLIGCSSIFIFSILVIIDLLFHFQEEKNWEKTMEENKITFGEITTSISCIIISFAYHPYSFSIYE